MAAERPEGDRSHAIPRNPAPSAPGNAAPVAEGKTIDLDRAIALHGKKPLDDCDDAFCEIVKTCDVAQLEELFDRIPEFCTPGEKVLFYRRFFNGCMRRDPAMAVKLADGVGPGIIRSNVINAMEDGITTAASFEVFLDWAGNGEQFPESMKDMGRFVHGQIFTLPWDEVEAMHLEDRTFANEKIATCVKAALAACMAREGMGADSSRVASLIGDSTEAATAYWTKRADIAPAAVEAAVIDGRVAGDAVRLELVHKLSFEKYRKDRGASISWVIDHFADEPWVGTMMGSLGRSWFDSDSLAMSEYVAELPESEQRRELAKVIVEHLNAKGDKDAADAWAARFGLKR